MDSYVVKYKLHKYKTKINQTTNSNKKTLYKDKIKKYKNMAQKGGSIYADKDLSWHKDKIKKYKNMAQKGGGKSIYAGKDLSWYNAKGTNLQILRQNCKYDKVREEKFNKCKEQNQGGCEIYERINLCDNRNIKKIEYDPKKHDKLA